MTDNYRARTLALLEKLGVSYVVVDEAQGFRSLMPPVVTATSPLAVIRFHGHNAETYESRIQRRALPLPVHGRGIEGLGRAIRRHLYRGEMSPALVSRGAFTDAFAFSGMAVILPHLRERQKGPRAGGWRRHDGDQAGLP